MPERTAYVQGTPNWVDLQTTDQDGAKAFYGELFGWRYDDQPAPHGVYSMALKAGGVVGAITSQSPEMAAQGVPPAWNTYLAVDDVDAAAARAATAGGQLLMGPFDVMDAGRLAFVADPTGAPVGLWQADRHIGATVVNEPGAVIWNELLTDDPEAAAAFYRETLGLTTEAAEMEGMGEYTMFKAGDDAVGGTTKPPVSGTPNHWSVYFAVEDAGDAIDRAKALGGTVLSGPLDTPIGFMGALADPQGGVFSIFAAKPQEA